MRFLEFADAEAQLGLLRLIIDNTWTAVEQQAEQQRRAEAERKARAATRPRASRTSKPISTKVQTLKPSTIPLPVKTSTEPVKSQPSVSNNTIAIDAQPNAGIQATGFSSRLKKASRPLKTQTFPKNSSTLNKPSED